MHCLDSLRQDVICTADDTPMPVLDAFKIGDRQERKCKNFDHLIQWAREPERHSCYHVISDYHTVYHPIEWYAFCPKDSPWREKQEAYFERHGHQDSLIP